jgi:hypothetical protein
MEAVLNPWDIRIQGGWNAFIRTRVRPLAWRSERTR